MDDFEGVTSKWNSPALSTDKRYVTVYPFFHSSVKRVEKVLVTLSLVIVTSNVAFPSAKG